MMNLTIDDWVEIDIGYSNFKNRVVLDMVSKYGDSYISEYLEDREALGLAWMLRATVRYKQFKNAGKAS